MKTRMTPAEEREQAEAMEVGLAQPHRNGSSDPKLESALGRFCAQQRLGEHCYTAGIEYRNVVREALNAQGLPVIGWAPSDDVGYLKLTEEQIAAKVVLARKREKDANAILFRLSPRLPSCMRALCYQEIDQAWGATDELVGGLVALAGAWGYLPKRSWDP